MGCIIKPARHILMRNNAILNINGVNDRDPFPNAKQSANWTGVGLCAHESALAGGKIVKLPAWSL